MKGIILAGGAGSRLYPITKGISKQLMPIYNKPMIYYPLSVLMMAGINEILFITNHEDLSSFQRLLGDGSKLGCSFNYEIQHEPNGLAQAFIIGENFIGSDSVVLILGDNIFFGTNFQKILLENLNPDGAVIFGYHVSDPERYGVVEFDESDGSVISLEEKPKYPKSNFAVPGLYFYDNSVIEFAKRLRPSARGEYEITDLNKIYLEKRLLKVALLNRGTAWLDTGTFNSQMQASLFVQAIEERQGLKVGCIEEIAWRKKFITADELKKLADETGNSSYNKYLFSLCNSSGG